MASKRTVRSKSRRTKARTLGDILAAAQKPKKASSAVLEQPAAPPVEAPEPTFTLSQISRLFGYNYGGDFDPVLTMALNALEDVRRTVRVCIEALPHQGDDSPIDPVHELLEQVWSRAEAGVEILNTCRVRWTLPATEGRAL